MSSVDSNEFRVFLRSANDLHAAPRMFFQDFVLTHETVTVALIFMLRTHWIFQYLLLIQEALSLEGEWPLM